MFFGAVDFKRLSIDLTLKYAIGPSLSSEKAALFEQCGSTLSTMVDGRVIRSLTEIYPNEAGSRLPTSFTHDAGTGFEPVRLHRITP